MKTKQHKERIKDIIERGLTPAEEAALAVTVDQARKAIASAASAADNAVREWNRVMSTFPTAEDMFRQFAINIDWDSGAIRDGSWLRDILMREAAEGIESLGDRAAHLEDLAQFRSAMDRIIAATQPEKRDALLAIEAAYALGVLAPQPREIREKTFKLFRSLAAKNAGTQSGKARHTRGWHAHAKELTLAIRGKDPSLTAPTVAREIACAWKLEKPKPPGDRTLIDFVHRLEREGAIKQPTGSLPKRTRSEQK
jgi:hypothetical protein